MSARFGRNKRRAARERVAALEAEVEQANRQLSALRRALSTAKEDGATELLRAKYLPQEIERITHYLADAYGPKLVEVADRLRTAEQNRPRAVLDFRAASEISQETFSVMTIEGSIPSLHYRVRMPTYDF